MSIEAFTSIAHEAEARSCASVQRCLMICLDPGDMLGDSRSSRFFGKMVLSETIEHHSGTLSGMTPE
jgi:hypothetical protein